MDRDIEELVRQERLLEAGKLASARGDARLASTLYERACDWSSAATEALRAGDGARAMELAAEAGDNASANLAMALVAREPTAEAVAARLERRGRGAWAARLFLACGRTLEAARAWERAGVADQAASSFERSGDPAAAVRVLDAALRRDPTAWEIATALGALLVRFGKQEAAVRVLQSVPRLAVQRRAALDQLIPALESLGLSNASREARNELAALGGTPRAPSGPVDPAPADRRRLFGRYDVSREVASSATAYVLECFDVVRGERVAIKRFVGWGRGGAGRDALARFEREARAMRALDHPNVVPLRDFVPDGPALVLGWMPGGTLERMLGTTRALPPSRAVEIATALLSAIGEAHRLGILHRNLKPSKVLFDDAGGAHVSDFGVAHLSDLSATATAGFADTLAYTSPEQRQGRAASARSDVFAVGAILREMLTGLRAAAAHSSQIRPSTAHRGLDAHHDAVVLALTANDPTERPADAFEARRTLADLTWPNAVDVRALATAPASDRPPADSPGAARTQVWPDGSTVDTWMGREVERIPLSESVLARGRAYALAHHPALQIVLRVAREEDALWLEAVRGRALNRALTEDERTRLAGALAVLHAAGVAHGRIDSGHVVVSPDGVVLRFATPNDPTATPEGDRLALERL